MNLRGIVQKGWSGEASLKSAFWGYFFLGQFAVCLLIVLVAAPFLLFGEQVQHLAFFITYQIYFGFLVWAMVSVWRCSKNSTIKIYSYMSQVFVVLYSGLWVLGYVQGWYAAT